jgi:hypothetical protein
MYGWNEMGERSTCENTAIGNHRDWRNSWSDRGPRVFRTEKFRVAARRLPNQRCADFRCVCGANEPTQPGGYVRTGPHRVCHLTTTNIFPLRTANTPRNSIFEKNPQRDETHTWDIPVDKVLNC